MNDCVEAAVSELRAAGIEPDVEQTRKHVKIRWPHGSDGRMYVTASSPSDRRAPLNVRSYIRRMLREDGVISAEAEVIERAVVKLHAGHGVVSSLDVARHFGKAHKNVLRDIDGLIAETGQEFAGLNFEPTDYMDSSGRKQRCFDLSRDGFALLAMGFTGEAATRWKLQYIEAFNLMEEELRQIGGSAAIPANVAARIERLECDLKALIDLSLGQQEPGFIYVRAHRRKVKRAA